MIEEVAIFGNDRVYLTALTKEEFEQLDNPHVSSVHAFPLDIDGDIVVTVNKRGYDIVGGHVEPGETPIEAMVREAFEEACIDVYGSYMIGAIRVDNRENPNSKYPPISYQVFYAVDDYILQPFSAKFECEGRAFIAKEDMAVKHHNWLGVHQKMLEQI